MVCHLITILLNICSARTWNRFQNIKKWRAPLTLPFSKGHEFKLISFYKATDHFLHKSHHQFPVRIPNQNPSGRPNRSAALRTDPRQASQAKHSCWVEYLGGARTPWVIPVVPNDWSSHQIIGVFRWIKAGLTWFEV